MLLEIIFMSLFTGLVTFGGLAIWWSERDPGPPASKTPEVKSISKMEFEEEDRKWLVLHGVTELVRPGDDTNDDLLHAIEAAVDHPPLTEDVEGLEFRQRAQMGLGTCSCGYDKECGLWCGDGSQCGPDHPKPPCRCSSSKDFCGSPDCFERIKQEHVERMDFIKHQNELNREVEMKEEIARLQQAIISRLRGDYFWVESDHDH